MAGGLKVGLTTLGQPGGQVGTAPRAVLGGTSARGGRDGDHVPTLEADISGKRLAVSGLEEKRARGDRKPESLLRT